MTLNPDAKIMQIGEYPALVESVKQQFRGTLSESDFTIFSDIVGDPGRFAALMGYDAIDCSSGFGTGVTSVVIINRTATSVSEELIRT